MLRLAIILAICAVFSCSGEDLSTFDAAEESPEFMFCDQGGVPDEDPSEETDQVDKSVSVIVPTHGWAVRSKLTLRTFNSLGQPIWPPQWGYEPCTCPSSGVCTYGHNGTCQNDYFIGGVTEWRNNVLGRCGSTTADFAACIRPDGNNLGPNAINKTWYYQIALGECVNDSARRAAFVNGVRAAFETIDDNTNHIFTEVTIPPPVEKAITVRCASPSEVAATPSGVIGTGVPSGQLSFTFGQPNSVTEVCDSNSYGTLGETREFMTDRFFTYRTGAIIFVWDRLWAALTAPSCSEKTQTGFYDRAIQYLTMHELGHVLGFVHQSYSNDATNVMGTGTSSCTRLNNPPYTGFPFQMDEAIAQYETYTGATQGSIESTNLSCLRPN